jgi:hypothetical protein
LPLTRNNNRAKGAHARHSCLLAVSDFEKIGNSLRPAILNVAAAKGVDTVRAVRGNRARTVSALEFLMKTAVKVFFLVLAIAAPVVVFAQHAPPSGGDHGGHGGHADAGAPAPTPAPAPGGHGGGHGH